MKYLIGAICAIVITMAFTSRKCEHKFTAVEQAVIKIEQPNLWQGGYYTIPQWPTGLQEGKELVCARCGLVQKQIMDYGKPEHGPTLTGLLSGIDSCLFIGDGKLTFDTVWAIKAK